MKTKSIILLATCMIFSFSWGFTQKKDFRFPKNAVFLELGGVGGHYSVKYNRVIFSLKDFHLSGGVGYAPSLIPLFTSKGFEYSPRFGTELSILYGSKKHFFEIGSSAGTYTACTEVIEPSFVEVILS
mgnify:CR=1 FL=1